MYISCIIIARGNSKGIPGKNLRDVGGKPLIYWTLKAACDSKYINDIWLSSDDSNIIKYGRSMGVRVIKRPMKYASDSASSESAWLHALSVIESDKSTPDLLVLPQVTSPIRGPNDFDLAISKLIDEKSDSLLSVSKISDYLVWSPSSSGFKSINYDFKNRLRRQEIEEKFLENGSFYLCKPNILRNNNNRLGGKISYYELEKCKQFQIDDEGDIEICEAILLRENLR